MKFAGQERDLGNLTSTADDIDYMHARYFRPLFGRFLSADRAPGSAEAERHAYRLTAAVAALANEAFKYEGGTFRPGMPAAQIEQEITKILSRMSPKYLQDRFAPAPWE